MERNSKPEEAGKPERIAKRIARAGLCSRRDAETWILQGRVFVNDKQLLSPAFTVTDTDKIIVDGKPLPDAQRTCLYLYHKPPGLVTSHKDERGRPTVFDRLPEHLPRLVSVGRLDLNSEGLLLLTNNGELARYLELPSTGWKRKYRVRVHGVVDLANLEKLAKGITVDGVSYGAINAVPEAKLLDKSGKSNTWLSVALREGKNREIRRVLESIGLTVNRLIRTDYGPFSLGKLSRGGVSEVKFSHLKEQIPHFFSKPKRKKNGENM